MKPGAASANANTNIPPWCNLRMIFSPLVESNGLEVRVDRFAVKSSDLPSSYG
jgi:hypothetical protein